MKILVCLKAVYDIEPLTREEWQEIVENDMTFAYIRKQLSCFDEAALELGLRLADALEAAGQPHHLTAVTIDAATDIDALLKGLYAVKVDRVCKLVPTNELLYAPQETARLLAEFVRANGGYDLILLGQQSVGADSGQTHWMLSELLGVPAVTHLCAATLQEQGLLVQHRRDKLLAEAQIAAPAILGVENTEYPYLRLATLREKMAASKSQVEQLPVKAPLLSGAPVRIWQQKQARHCRLLEGETTGERVQQLVQDVLREVL